MKRKMISVFLCALIVNAIFVMNMSIPDNVSGAVGDLELKWYKHHSGYWVSSVDISDGYPSPGDVYVVAGLTYIGDGKLAVYDGYGNTQWIRNIPVSMRLPNRKTTHSVAISGNAEYVAAALQNGEVRVYGVAGTSLWNYDMGSEQAYSVDISNPLQNNYNKAYVVACCGKWVYVFDADSTPPVAPLWSEEVAGGYYGHVSTVRISENGEWIAVGCDGSDSKVAFFHNTYDPINGHQHEKLWESEIVDAIVNVEIGRGGQIVVAGEDCPGGAGTSDVYEFDAGDDKIWGTGDDQVPRWTRSEQNDIYAVAVSDSELIPSAGPDFSVISGQTHVPDAYSEECYYYSSTPIRNWPTGLIISAAATYDDDPEYNFRFFGGEDFYVYFVSQDSDTVLFSDMLNGYVNSVAISFSFVNEEKYGVNFDYFVAGTNAGSIYFYSYNYGESDWLRHYVDDLLDVHQPTHVATALINSDPYTDVVATYLGFNSADIGAVVWYENKIPQEFPDPVYIDNMIKRPWGVACGDLNGDLTNDVVVAGDWNCLYWYANNGLGGFSGRNVLDTTLYDPKEVFIADINGDTLPDVVATGAGGIAWSNMGPVKWYQNLGGGSFAPGRLIDSLPYGCGLYVADIDGINGPDVIATSTGMTGILDDGSIVWYANDGLGGFSPRIYIDFGRDGCENVFATDVDIDGNIDIVASMSDDNDYYLGWYKNMGGGVFLPLSIIDNGLEYKGLDMADINLDGREDIVIATGSADNWVLWYEKPLNPMVDPWTKYVLDDYPFPPPADGRDVSVANLDNDLDIDVVSALYGQTDIIWYENRLI